MALHEALRRAQDCLLGLQSAEGWWKGELQTNVTIDAEDLLLRHFLGVLDPREATGAARWIRNNARPDGTWATFYGGPPELSTTVEAYVALRLAGDEPSEPHMVAAATWIRANGGVEASRVFTRIWMALVGEWDWEKLPILPPEIMLLPPSVPLSIYDFACWARQSIVALSVVFGHRPTRPLPFRIDELRAETAEPAAAAGSATSSRRQADRGHPTSGWHALASVAGRFELVDGALHHYEHLPSWVSAKPRIRHESMSLAEQWIVRRQEADGGWGGIQAPLVYSIIALHLQGYALHHPVMQAALKGLHGLVIDDERGRWLEACQSPVWDTALAVVALADSGVSPSHPALAAASRWLIENEVRARGDWSVHRPNLQPGGWAFEFANDNYPDIDDTAEVVLALRRAQLADGGEIDAAIRRGVVWTVGMQSRNGGWGAFDADNTSELAATLPFSDFGKVTDPPSADVTAHVIEMLAAEPEVPKDVMAQALAWLSDQQETDGSWYGRWGVNYLYGTGAAVPALIRAGVAPTDPRIRRAVSWLERHQNDDGGWGEDIRSYVDSSWRGRGASSASQTGWALLALLAAGDVDSDPTQRGVGYLIRTQTPEGTWNEPWFTGTGFPWDFSIRYDMYRLVWPLTALGRYAAQKTT